MLRQHYDEYPSSNFVLYCWQIPKILLQELWYGWLDTPDFHIVALLLLPPTLFWDSLVRLRTTQPETYASCNLANLQLARYRGAKRVVSLSDRQTCSRNTYATCMPDRIRAFESCLGSLSHCIPQPSTKPSTDIVLASVPHHRRHPLPF